MLPTNFKAVSQGILKFLSRNCFNTQQICNKSRPGGHLGYQVSPKINRTQCQSTIPMFAANFKAFGQGVFKFHPETAAIHNKFATKKRIGGHIGYLIAPKINRADKALPMLPANFKAIGPGVFKFLSGNCCNTQQICNK